MGLNLTSQTFAVPEHNGALDEDAAADRPQTACRPAWPRVLAQAALRVVIAALLSVAVVVVGVTGMYVTSAPRWISLLVEPFSFLLAPGAIYAWGQSAFSKLDFSSNTVVRASLVFYFLLFTLILLARLRTSVQALMPGRTRRRRSR